MKNFTVLALNQMIINIFGYDCTFVSNFTLSSQKSLMIEISKLSNKNILKYRELS
jgi:hypothetical protein